MEHWQRFVAALGGLAVLAGGGVAAVPRPEREQVPERSRPLYDEAMAKAKSSDAADVLPVFERLADREPKTAVAQKLAGEVAADAGQMAAAVKWYTRAVELDPKMTPAWGLRGHAHHALGKLREAEADFTKVLELDPNHDLTWRNRAILRRQLDRKEDALKDAAAARKLSGDRDNVYLHALLLYETFRPFQALEEADGLVAAHPDFAEGRELRGMVLTVRLREKEAEAEFAKAVELDPAAKGRVAENRQKARDLAAQLLKAAVDPPKK